MHFTYHLLISLCTAGRGRGGGVSGKKYIHTLCATTSALMGGKAITRVYWKGTPTKCQFSICQISKRPVSKRLKCQVYKTSGMENVSVYKTSGLQNVRSSKRPVAKNIHIYSVLVVGGNPQVLLQPCLQEK
jgi:hypothetical protein